MTIYLTKALMPTRSNGTVDWNHSNVEFVIRRLPRGHNYIGHNYIAITI